MLASRLTAWLRPALSLLATAGVLALSACGGGSGAPNNPFAPAPTSPGPLTVEPAKDVIAYAGTPLVLSIAGGTPPYFAFAANPAALPAPATIAGSTITLLANNVAQEQQANITIRDSAGQSATSEISVRPSSLLPATIQIQSNAANCTTNNVCSGQNATVSIRVTAAGGVPIAGRQVRFDVVQGQYAIQTSNPGAPLAQTQTVVSDANGDARVVIAVPPNTSTQVALIRATDVTTGNQVTGQFVIEQQQDVGTQLTMLPTGTTTINGPSANVCSSGVRVTHYIFGGTPPYRVQVNFPDAVTLVGVPVLVSGGGFDVITNGTCFTGLAFTVSDATGRVLTQGIPTVTNAPGTGTPTPTPAPLQVAAPSAGTQAAPIACGPGTTVPITITGRAPFSAAFVSPPGVGPLLLSPNPVPTSPGTLLVSGLDSAPAGVQAYTITIGDSNTTQQFASVQIFCQ